MPSKKRLRESRMKTAKSKSVPQSKTIKTKLQENTLEYIYKHFPNVSNDTEFLQLNQDQLCKLIENDDICIQEEDVFYSVVKWFEHDKVSRTESMLPLLKQIRFASLTCKFIADNCRLVCKTNECTELILNWIEWHLAPENRSQIKDLNTKPRKPSYMQTLMAITKDNNEFYMFDPVSNSHSQQIAPKSFHNRTYYASTSIYNKLIISGGVGKRDHNLKHSNLLNSVICIDLKTNQVRDLPPMKYARCWHSSLFVNGALYVVGGKGISKNILYSIEKFDFLTRTWMVIGSIPHILYTGAVALNNEIFGFGFKKKMFSYNTITRETLTKPYKNVDSIDVVYCAVNGYIYSVGSYSEDDDMIIVERYDPCTEEWSYIKSVQLFCTSVKCSSYNNRLLVVGYDKEGSMTSAKEYFSETDEWKTLAVAPTKEAHSNILVIEEENCT